MSIRFNYDEATVFLLNQAEMAEAGKVDLVWVDKIETLSRLCEEASVRTHIAFLGTALLAKALNHNVDPHTVKPTHAPNKERAYPARTLAEKVLVPVSIQVGFHLGVTGREPLNNQPYFRMRWLGDDTPISSNSRPPFIYMMGLIEELANASSEEATAGLRAFIAVRKTYATAYESFSGDVSISLEAFPQAITAFVDENSENGKRAQAIAAGLFDLVETPEQVLSGRINDPSRKHPGDVCVVSLNDDAVFEKAMEVRDKPVKESDAFVFAGACLRFGITDVAILMVSSRQPKLDENALSAWAEKRGISFRLYYGWEDIMSEALFWGATPMRPAVSLVISLIENRLREVEISNEGYDLWRQTFRARS